MTTDLPHILNWRRVDDRITLSGQPSEEEFSDIAQIGVRHVINLGPHDNDGALEDEQATLDALDIGYTYIPVDFENPTDADFHQFCDAMSDLSDVTLHIHCIYNARVSAFMTRYAQEGRGEDPEIAKARMDSIWRPGGVWAGFLNDAANVNQPNRYAGQDY